MIIMIIIEVRESLIKMIAWALYLVNDLVLSILHNPHRSISDYMNIVGNTHETREPHGKENNNIVCTSTPSED